MGNLRFCPEGHLGFCLIALLALSLCYGNHVTANLEGFTECAHCVPVGVTSLEASSGTGPFMNPACKSTRKFKIKFFQDKKLQDQVERASGAPCPGQEVPNVLAMISKAVDNVKQTSAMIRKLKFSSITSTLKILWPFDKKNKQLIHVLPSPGKSSEYPHQPSAKAFLSPKSGLMEQFPASVKNSKPLSSLMSRKLLDFPVHFPKPIFPPLRVIKYPSPEVAPPAGNPPPLDHVLKKPVLAPPAVSRMTSAPIVSMPKKPPPPSRPNFEKPLPPVPPPMPPLFPPTVQAQDPAIRILPPAPYIKEPTPQPTPMHKNAPLPHFQRPVPPTAAPPMLKTPHFPPLAPTYKNSVPVPAPTPHLKKTPPPVAPVPTYKDLAVPPPMHSPGPILQKPNPPPVPIFKKSAPPPQSPVPVQQPSSPLHPPISPKPTTPAPSHSARPVLQKPNTPPVPTFQKSVPPPFPSSKAPVHPPISPTPPPSPSPKLAHKSAPSPLPIVNQTPPTKQLPSPPAPQQKSFYPIPKAPPIPQLPPVPTVPRRYFNSPKSGSQPSSPPS